MLKIIEDRPHLHACRMSRIHICLTSYGSYASVIICYSEPGRRYYIKPLGSCQYRTYCICSGIGYRIMPCHNYRLPERIGRNIKRHIFGSCFLRLFTGIREEFILNISYPEIICLNFGPFLALIKHYQAVALLKLLEHIAFLIFRYSDCLILKHVSLCIVSPFFPDRDPVGFTIPAEHSKGQVLIEL